ncbi:biotinidase [Thecamonas trahens ATCC 50062]|uniref:Biotinidase n=1 Tax=Thecamonas trahens ATCC 50062 TaxID=461836 RepID=A0A0L0DVZ8_THETB|nr:biotinidase [Thecamonas trahens ATCC 50062]KNC56251.1 biotinidase [Thecamonas trahens ATCC 50062]|eukprot:XP_013760773.1 biotinidase [Thecamonas trahens ATCC 50062]
MTTQHDAIAALLCTLALVLVALMPVAGSTRSATFPTASAGRRYRAAAVERAPIVGHDGMDVAAAEKLMLANLDEINVAVGMAAGRGADLVVLPEDNLYGAGYSAAGIAPFLAILPAARQLADHVIVPCTNATMWADAVAAARASCIARDHGVVLVLDMAEQVACLPNERCPPIGYWAYNTQIALDADGRLLAKYHKLHLYYEAQFDVPTTWAPVWFTPAKLDVTFGMMVCFDLLFARPANGDIAAGITDFVFSSFWVNEPPLLTLPAVLRGWSSAHNASIVAAGTGSSWYNSGSGLFSRGKTLASWYNPGWQGETQVLVHDVVTFGAVLPPLVAPPPSPFRFPACGKRSSPMVTTFNVTASSSGTATAHAGGVTCTARYRVSETSTASEIYAVVALDGCFSPVLEARVCGLVRCLSAEACLNTGLLAANTSFASLTMTAHLAAGLNDGDLVFGLASASNGVPLDSQLYSEHRSATMATMASTGTLDNVVSFSMFIRNEWMPN